MSFGRLLMLASSPRGVFDSFPVCSFSSRVVYQMEQLYVIWDIFILDVNHKKVITNQNTFVSTQLIEL